MADIVLHQGSVGSEVFWLQENLHFLGFPLGISDSQFGPRTEGAVREYQRVRGLSQDGRVRVAPNWGETWTRITGEVKWVQGRLNLAGFNCGNPDGYAGPNTVRETKKFQTKYALVADGIAGSHTRAELENPQLPKPAITLPPPLTAIPSGLVFVPREQWGARPPRLPNPTAGKSLEIIHHTDTAQGPDEAAIMRSMQNFHMDTRGWNDLAYSYGVGALTGNVYVGRGLLAVGAHTKGYNTPSIGVAVIGTYQNIEPTQAALVTLRRLNQWFESRVGALRVDGHRAYNQTDCPGDRLYAAMPR